MAETIEITKESLERLMARVDSLEQQVATLKAPADEEEKEEIVSIVVSSNDLDKLLPAFIIATGACSMGMKAKLFFTLWGTTALKKKTIYKGKTLPEMMLTMMLPGQASQTKLSKMHMFGMGTGMMKMLMKKHHVTSLPDLMKLALDLGVEINACQMTMGLMGINQEELIDDISYCGVAAYLEGAARSKVTLFI